MSWPLWYPIIYSGLKCTKTLIIKVVTHLVSYRALKFEVLLIIKDEKNSKEYKSLCLNNISYLQIIMIELSTIKNSVFLSQLQHSNMLVLLHLTKLKIIEQDTYEIGYTLPVEAKMVWITKMTMMASCYIPFSQIK